MAIDYLRAIISPPLSITEPADFGGWTGVESRLGTTLPEDYKEFVDLYGSGQIGGFLWVFNPFSANDNLNLEKQAVLQATVLNELRSYGEVIPYASFPDSSGVLPFGITDNGDVLFWLTGGNPNDWPVLVNESRSPEWEKFELSMTRFLAEIFSKNVVCNAFPRTLAESSVTFSSSH